MSLFGGGGKSTSSSAPAVWAPQEPFLKFGMGEARNIYDQFKGTPAYEGSYYAGLNPLQTNTLDTMYSQGTALPFMGGQIAQSGLAQLPFASGFGQNAASTYGRAAFDPTNTIYETGQRFADNPYISDMIRAASRDDVRAVTEGQLPALNQEATETGNAYSSRAGVAEGVLRRGLEDRIGDIGANIRGSMFNKGLDTAQSQWNQNLANMVAANQQLGAAGSLGAQQVAAGAGVAGTGFDWQNAAGGAYQADAQAKLDELYRKYAEGQNRPWDLLNQYWGVAGWGGGPGQSSTSTVTGPSQGIIPGILGAASAGMGTYGAGRRFGFWG